VGFKVRGCIKNEMRIGRSSGKPTASRRSGSAVGNFGSELNEESLNRYREREFFSSRFFCRHFLHSCQKIFSSRSVRENFLSRFLSFKKNLRRFNEIEFFPTGARDAMA
jgi:hypothetical protein